MSAHQDNRDGYPEEQPYNALPAADVSTANEKYFTDLDYISTWDVLHYQPSDSFMYGIERTVLTPLAEEKSCRDSA